MMESKCLTCDKSFSIYPYEEGKRKFCSQPCYGGKERLDPNEYIGKVFGKTTVLEFIESKKYYFDNRYKTLLVFKVQCSCGKIRQANHSDLKRGKSDQCRSCGNAHRSKIEIGKKYNSWTVLEEAGRYSDRKGENQFRQFKCQCDCGNIKTIIGTFLIQGATTKCKECAHKSYETHGLSYSTTYKSWRGMFNRCNNIKNENYGARGIKICARWNKFENFLDDMGLKPDGDKIALDRIDPDGNYSKDNCRWVTMLENNNNRRNSKNNKHLYIYIRKDKLCNHCQELK